MGHDSREDSPICHDLPPKAQIAYGEGRYDKIPGGLISDTTARCLSLNNNNVLWRLEPDSYRSVFIMSLSCRQELVFRILSLSGLGAKGEI